MPEEIISPIEEDTSTQYNTPPDSSALFNERGFNKSNGFTYDEQEIINDFNGGLSYNIPLYKFKGVGDLFVDLSLCYCNSVNHNIIARPSTFLNNGGRFSQYNYATPDWIFNLNGIGVQMLNFETDFFTTPHTTDPTVKDRKIKLLTNGYHITNEIDEYTLGSSFIDTIYLLMGDGSVETLKNTNQYSIDGVIQRYIGYYLSVNKQSYTRAYVEYMEPEGNLFRARKLTLMKGDGLSYIYHENFIPYTDFDSGSLTIFNQYKKPKSFLLKEIKDRFGNKICLCYNSSNNAGRPILSTIICNWDNAYNITFGIGSGILIQNNIKGNFTIETTPFISIPPGGNVNRRVMVSSIINPVLDTMYFSYQSYQRKAIGLYHGGRSEENPANPIRVNIEFTTSVIDGKLLNRLIKVTNYAGGVREYDYKIYDGGDLNMNPIEGHTIQTQNNNYYFGQGRDLFFTNMLLRKLTKIGGVSIKKESFDYSYIDNPTNSPDRFTNPIDNRDEYYSSRITESEPGSANFNFETPNKFRVLSRYEIYKVRPLIVNFGNYDSPGEIKLVSEKFYMGEEVNPYKSKGYLYVTGDIQNGAYTGSFLESKVIETFERFEQSGITREYNYTYEHFSSTGDPFLPPSGNTYDFPLMSKTEIDPLLNKTYTQYAKTYKKLLQSFMDGYFNPDSSATQMYDTIHFYVTNLAKVINKLDSSNNLLDSDLTEYLGAETFSFGAYCGQIIKKSKMNIFNSNDFIITEFRYYRADTLGALLYTPISTKPSLEGNLKSSKSPRGHFTRYYYHPISEEENNYDPGPAAIPKVSYKKVFDNGTTVNTSSVWQDRRLPTRIDYPTVNNEKIIIYEKRNYEGNLLEHINSNKRYSDLKYDNLGRIKRVRLPFDFPIDNDEQKGTQIYNYNDINNVITLESKVVSNVKKKTETIYDGMYRIIENRVYTGPSSFNTNKTDYNYLDNKAITKDGLNYQTKYSYNKYLMVSKIENEDASFSTVVSTYQENISSYFGQIFPSPNGFINKQLTTDEEGNTFEKYFDALGNLRREIKYVMAEVPPGDAFLLAMVTDYLYDNLYRLIKVKTPTGKSIEYQYDGFGRQSRRTTPDSGVVNFTYDKDGNLVYSQDANQLAAGSHIFTFRTYDPINRLLVLGINSLPLREFSQMDPDSEEQFLSGDSSNPYSDYLIVNVYDDLNSAPANIFNPPSDYTPNAGNSFYFREGALVATAYRTRKTDVWDFKYYKYDERGRVVKVWNVINALGTKTISYFYNSQNQIIRVDYNQVTEYKRFRYNYDTAGRLSSVDYYTDPSDTDNPVSYVNLVSYGYNANSQIEIHSFAGGGIDYGYSYNNRNWISEVSSKADIFNYINTYFKNGNVKTQALSGSYKDGFEVNTDLTFTCAYDKSYRLVSSQISHSYRLFNTYDDDGNILTLKRYGGANGGLEDNFVYSYYSGTNKLSKVTGSTDQYTYDLNGNMITDDLNSNIGILYDHRNLITQLRHTENDIIYETKYYYDEAGNRVRKEVFQIVDDGISGGEEDPLLLKNEVYLRGADGKDLVIYLNGTLEQWNIFGLSNEGKISNSGEIYFYLKDHLGSVRVMITEKGSVKSAQDYDAWGYLLSGRIMKSEDSKYKFTEKERDDENKYDYFGARYYDSRIGRWGSIDSLLEKHYDFSPYNYVLCNPLIYFDPNGRQTLALELVKAAKTIGPAVGIPISPIGIILSSLLSPTTLGLNDVNTSIFYMNELGELIYLFPIDEIAINEFGGVKSFETKSVSIWKEKGGKGRIDVELEKPEGELPDVHYQNPGKYPNKKFRFDYNKGKFIDKDTKLTAPKSIQKLLQKEGVKRALEKALRYIGGEG